MSATLKVRLAVFDCDGTLVDGQHSIIASMNRAFENHGLARPAADAVRRVVGLPLREAIVRLLPDAADADHARLESGYVEAYSALRRKGAVNDPLFPGAVETLDALDRAGWILGIATGKGRRGLLATLESHGIAGRFAILQTSDSGPGKPNPDMPEMTMVLTIEATDGGSRMTVEARFPSAEVMQQLLEMGMEEGIRAAAGQIDDLLAETPARWQLPTRTRD